MSANGRGRSRRRLLILAAAFPPDPFVGAARPGRFAKYLPEHGYDVDVIAGEHGAPETAQVRRVPYGPGPGPGERLSRLAYALRRGLPYEDGLPFSAQVLAAADSMMRERRYDAVLATAPPMGLHVAALWLKRRHGAPCVCDFRDPLLGHPFRGRKWLFPHDRWLENWIARSADAVICNTDEAGKAWRARHPEKAARMEVMWNGYDPEAAAHAKAGEGNRTLAHVGTVYRRRHPGMVLESLDRLISSGALAGSDARVALSGPLEPGSLDHSSAVVDRLMGLGVLGVDGRTLPQDEAERLVHNAGALLLVDFTEKQQSLQVPGKLFGYVISGKPVLAVTYGGSPALRILELAGTPFVWIDPRWGTERVDAAVMEFFRMPWAAREPSEEFKRRFDGQRQAAELAKLLDRVVSGG